MRFNLALIMKNSCLFLFAVLFGLGFYYYSYLSGTSLSDKWWIGPLLSLSVVIFLANLQGIYFAVRQKIVSGRPETQWKDGQLVGFSGRIQSTGDPIEAPFSGTRSVMVEYEMSQTFRDSDNSSSKTRYIHGMLMSPCAVQTRRRAVKIVGFPLLANMHPKSQTDESCYRNAAKFILNTKFEEISGNPMAIIKRMSEILADDDGDVRANFKEKRFTLDTDMTVLEDFESDETTINPPVNTENLSPEAAKEEELYRVLLDHAYDLNETRIDQGEEVTVFGTYKAAKQAVDIGSGLKNLQHTIQPGKIEAVIYKNMVKSLILSAVFGAITFFAHKYVAQLIGLELF